MISARLVLKQGMSLVAAGMTAAFARTLTSMLYKVAPMDPAAFGGAALVVLIVAFLACYAPARRAAKVDPIVALRDQ